MKVKIAQIPNISCTAQDFADVNPKNFDAKECLGCSFFRACKPPEVTGQKMVITFLNTDKKEIALDGMNDKIEWITHHKLDGETQNFQVSREGGCDE